MKFINWIRSSVEGKDGKSSARALTNFWYVALNTGISICVVVLAFTIVSKTNATINDSAVDALWGLIWLSVIFNLTILLIFGIVSMQQVTELSRSIRGNDSVPQSPIKVETVTTTEIKKDNEVC